MDGCGNCCVGGGSMTTLENLYNGNINPSDLDELKYNPEYSRALNRVCAARQKLTDSLSAEQRELLERYITKADELSIITDKAIFKSGFSLAIKIMTEIR